MSKNDQLTEWVYQYSDDLYQYLIYRVGTREVEDLLQEVFIKAMKGMNHFKANSSVKTWLISIARRVAIDEYRRKNRFKVKRMVSLSDKGYKEPLSLVTPETILGDKEKNRMLYEAIQRLKLSYRDVVILRGIKSFSVTETADILDWSENKVRSTYHRAKMKLHKELEGEETHGRSNL